MTATASASRTAPASRPEADGLLLMPEPLATLREKLTAASSPLAPWYRHLRALARGRPDQFDAYTVLAALVGGETQDRELAKQAFRQLVEKKEEGEVSMEAQLNTHVVAAPLGRWAIYYDWLAETDLFTDADHAAIRDAIVDLTFVFAQQQLQGRTRRFDNQVLANAFGAAAVGEVFGFRRDTRAEARRLRETGLAAMQGVLERVPAGGYSMEGSTYHEHVVEPLVGLSGQLYEALTGRDVFHQGVSDEATPLRRVLELSDQLISPPGCCRHGTTTATRAPP